jgi:hypothetical protein
MVDLSVADLSTEDLSIPPDLRVGPEAGVDAALDFSLDLLTPDLEQPPDLRPFCTTSTSCGDPALPICELATHSCRACSGSSDDSACALHGAGLRCETSGANTGKCEPCIYPNNSQCPAATPVCNPDGTCRGCVAHSECTSGVCDLRGTATNGQCADASDIALVKYRDTGGSSCAEPSPSPIGGSSPGNAYCQVNTALGDMGSRHFVIVGAPTLGTPPQYFAPNVTNSVIAYLVGPGTSSSVFILDVNGKTIELGVASGQSADLTFDGFNLTSGDINHSNVYCNAASGGSAKLTVKNSLITGGLNGFRVAACNGTLTESTVENSVDYGVLTESTATYFVQNVMIFGCGAAGFYNGTSTAGNRFNFNTLSNNGTAGSAGGAVCDSATPIDDSIIAGNTQATSTSSQFAGNSVCALNNVATGGDSQTSGAIPAPSPIFNSTTDLHLKVDANSIAANRGCCIDQIPVSVPSPTPLPAIDIDHSLRPKGPKLDIGAHEAQ